MLREGVPHSFNVQNIEGEPSAHVPRMLEWQERYPQPSLDVRGFELHDPGSNDPEFFKRQIIDWQHIGDSKKLEKLKDRNLVSDLTRAFGRIPEPDEIARELFRQQLFDQILIEDRYYNNPSYVETEALPQQHVIQERRNDFPDAETATESFRKGHARIDIDTHGTTRLIIEVPNAEGITIEHPVMTDEEIEWVEKSADTISRVLKQKPGSKIFIAGLGLGLLNRELAKRGITLDQQVVAELNEEVAELVGGNLIKEFGKELSVRQGTSAEVYTRAIASGEHFDIVSQVNSTEHALSDMSALDLRHGDFKDVLTAAIDGGEQFEAISIDAFPNSADEVNRDASSTEVLELAMKALKPGGILTFYPDSRYIPERILNVLARMDIPHTSIHYTVAKFHTSEFTQQYHYGDLMAVVHIQKPLLDSDSKAIKTMVKGYFDGLSSKMADYEKNLQDELAG